jgi:hypothetical protein
MPRHWNAQTGPPLAAWFAHQATTSAGLLRIGGVGVHDGSAVAVSRIGGRIGHRTS